MNASLTTESQSVTLIYVDGTKGWQDIRDSTSNVPGQLNYVEATGGNTTITTGDFRIHVFPGGGSFCVGDAGKPSGDKVVLEHLVVAGGGGGGKGDGAGGGAGGFRYFSALSPAAPLVAAAGITAITGAHLFSVGGGGAGTSSPGCRHFSVWLNF